MDRPRLAIAMALAGASLIPATFPAAAQDLPPADTVWRYVAPAELTHLRECPDAELLVVTKRSIIGLDAVTGSQLWELGDLPSMAEGLYWGRCDTPVGLSYRRDRIVAFDIATGRRLWDGAVLPPYREIRGYFPIPREDLVLLFLRTAASESALAAVELSSGRVLWSRDDAFGRSPRFAGRDGVSDISEYQSIALDTDTTIIVYFSADGPMRLDRRTGATLWVGERLAGPRVPAVGDYAAMLRLDTLLIIPRDRGLVAVDTRDGHVVWDAPALLPAHATRLLAVPSGLLVRSGRAHVVVLDPATAAPRWPPLTVRTDGMAYAVEEDRYYVVARHRLMMADLATGDTTGLATLAFDGSEEAASLHIVDDRLVVMSRQNLISLDRDGAIRYHRYFRAPGASFLEKVAGAMGGNVGIFSARLGAAALRTHYAYFTTNAPDADGRTGNSLVRVSVDDGEEAGRVWFRDRAPVFRPDTPRDQVLVLEGARTLVAIRFPAATELANRH
jgi:hypothetical protein